MNILVFGVTGVGKFIIIDAFINYLAFNSLEQAEKEYMMMILITYKFPIIIDERCEAKV